MKVICAGYPKTGTKTLNAALTQLGFKCFDVTENLEYLGKDWMKILKEGGNIEDFQRMFKDVDAVMDIPCCFFWEELHKAFPEAKIIFSQRESEDIWWKSFEKQFLSYGLPILRCLRLLSPTTMITDRMITEICRSCLGICFEGPILGTIKINELMARKFYRLHNQYFLNNAPKDQVLMINFAEGWEPLCKFLDVPVPDLPFPHKNKGAELVHEWLKTNSLMLRMQRELMTSSIVLTCISGYGIYKLVTRPSTSPSLLSYPLSVVEYVSKKCGLELL